MLTTIDWEEVKLKGCANHRMFVHSRTQCTFFGIGALAFGVGWLGKLMHVSATIWEICFLIEFVSLTIFCLRLAIPCNCGKTILLDPKSRLSKKRRRRYQITIGIFVGVLGFFLMSAVALIPVALALLGFRSVGSFLVGLEFIVIGLAALIAVFMPKFPSRYHVISESDLRHFALLEGQTEDDFQKLVTFHLSLGNYDEAELYSQKLVTLCEKNS